MAIERGNYRRGKKGKGKRGNKKRNDLEFTKKGEREEGTALGKWT